MKYIIVGGVAGGASTAARLRRLDEHAEIIIFEKGAYISYANCGLPYYIGNVIKERNKLFVQTATAFNQRFNVDVRMLTEVVSISPTEKKITAVNLQTAERYDENYDKLVLSTGAEPIRPPLPGISLPGIFSLRNVADTDSIKQHLNITRPANAVIIGAGFIGLEMAENLHHAGVDVTIVEMGKQILPPVDYPIAAITQQHLRTKGITLNLNTTVIGFERNDAGIKVLLTSGAHIDTDMVILSIGVKPDTKLAINAGLATGAGQGISVNEFLQTSDPDIYAVGDAIEFRNPITQQHMPTYLAGPANKQGRICADNMVTGNTRAYKGSINTAIVKVFDMTVGTAGLSSKQLTALGTPHIVSTTHSGSHAGYYPGSQQMTIQLAFSPTGGKILGAQVAGHEGVDKRLDVLSNIIQHGGTVADLTDFEHAYAPPYSSAKDPVNMAGYVAENIMMNRLNIFYWNQAEKLSEENTIVDVRTPEEYGKGSITNAINIPIDDLRSRMNELPKGEKITIYCEGGQRGYLAQRILVQNGFTNVVNLSGGYRLWVACNTETTLNLQTEKTLA